MKCILHIGTEKTGTTFLQKWLYDNQKALLEDRIFLSNFLKRYNNRDLCVYCQNSNDDFTRINNIETVNKKARFFRGFVADFKKEISDAESECDYAIITSEHFHSRLRTIDEIKKLKRILNKIFTEVIVVCYFREQSDMAISYYSTNLKSGSTQNIKKYLNSINPDNYYFNFKQIADNWAEVFGKDACKYRIYSRENFISGDLRKDFLSLVSEGVSYDRYDWTENRENASLSYIEAMLFREINELEKYWLGNKRNQKNIKIKKLVQTVKGIQRKPLKHKDSALVFQRFKESNKKFFDKYFNGENHFILRDGQHEKINHTCSIDILIDLFKKMYKL